MIVGALVPLLPLLTVVPEGGVFSGVLRISYHVYIFVILLEYAKILTWMALYASSFTANPGLNDEWVYTNHIIAFQRFQTLIDR